jgi:hypothetical protein
LVVGDVGAVLALVELLVLVFVELSATGAVVAGALAAEAAGRPQAGLAGAAIDEAGCARDEVDPLVA